MKRKSLIYGVRPIIEAINSGKELDKILITKGNRGESIKLILKAAQDRNIPYQLVPNEKLQRITSANHQGIIAFISPIEYQSISQLVPTIFESGEVPFFVILDRITDVRNFGAICRTAECAGVHAVVVPQFNSAQINEDAIKTSAGAIHNVAICREKNFHDTFQFLQNSGFIIFAICEKSRNTIYDSDLTKPLAIVLGNEGDGINEEYNKYFSNQLSIPMAGAIKSLNVSVAAGISLFEVVRQRMKL